MKLHHLELAPRTGPASGTLVLLHGYGADERDLLSLAHELDPSLRAVSLQGPHALGGVQRAWFNLQQTAGGFAFDPGEVDDALVLAIEAVEEIAHADGRPPVLLGFSQGAAMALCIALLRPTLARGVLSFSGVPPALPEERMASPAALRGLPVFAAHGLYDPLIPIDLGRMLRGALAEKGLAVEWREYAMGHQVVEQELADAAAWLKGVRERS